MRILTFFAALVGTVLFAVEFWHVASIDWIVEAGLANPTLRIDVLPERKPRLVTAFVLMFVTWYVWLVVVWVERNLAMLAEPAERADQSAADAVRPLQPLKEAIRRGDFEAAYRQVRGFGSLPEEDDDRLSPEELAEIYDRADILDLLRAGIRRSR